MGLSEMQNPSHLQVYHQAILAISPSNPDIVSPGGWRWTSFSPTRSDPEGSSRNEPNSGLCSSLPLKRGQANWELVFRPDARQN